MPEEFQPFEFTMLIENEQELDALCNLSALTHTIPELMDAENKELIRTFLEEMFTSLMKNYASTGSTN